MWVGGLTCSTSWPSCLPNAGFSAGEFETSAHPDAPKGSMDICTYVRLYIYVYVYVIYIRVYIYVYTCMSIHVV